VPLRPLLERRAKGHVSETPADREYCERGAGEPTELEWI
jgi:hypothetical protein